MNQTELNSMLQGQYAVNGTMHDHIAAKATGLALAAQAEARMRTRLQDEELKNMELGRKVSDLERQLWYLRDDVKEAQKLVIVWQASMSAWADLANALKQEDPAIIADNPDAEFKLQLDFWHQQKQKVLDDPQSFTKKDICHAKKFHKQDVAQGD